MPIYETPAFLMTLCAIVGLCVGSFLNVVILRLPKLLEYQWRRNVADELGGLPSQDSQDNGRGNGRGNAPPSLNARSRCGSCSAALPAWQLVPVLSFLLLRRRCAACQAPISWRYPLVELLTAIAFALCAWRFGYDLALPFALVATALLIVIAGVDADTQWLPDELTTPLMLLGWLAAYLSVFVSPMAALFGGLLGYLLPWSIARVHTLLTGRDGLGDGDVKLLGAVGFCLGSGVLSAILLGAVLGLIYAMVSLWRSKQQWNSAVAFGPALCVAAWLTLVFNLNFFKVVH